MPHAPLTIPGQSSSKGSRPPQRQAMKVLEDYEHDYDAALLEILRDVEPGWEGHVLAGNVEHAENGGNREQIAKANRLYTFWEASQGRMDCSAEECKEKQSPCGDSSFAWCQTREADQRAAEWRTIRSRSPNITRGAGTHITEIGTSVAVPRKLTDTSSALPGVDFDTPGSDDSAWAADCDNRIRRVGHIGHTHGDLDSMFGALAGRIAAQQEK